MSSFKIITPEEYDLNLIKFLQNENQKLKNEINELRIKNSNLISENSTFKTIVENEKVIKKVDDDKKQEIIQSLEYLKSKEVKTKQDQISIYTLEVILKGMK
jgi:hypothetical protein